MNDLQKFNGRHNGIQKREEEQKREVIVLRPQTGIQIEVPRMQEIMENVAYAGGNVASKMTETTMFCPDGTVIQEKSMNVWINEHAGISAEEARIRKLKGMQDLARRLGR